MRPTTTIVLVIVLTAATAAAEIGGGVLLLPFGPVDDSAKTDWIGRAIQQNLLSELSHVRALQPMTPTTQPAGTDVASLTKAGKAAGVDFVVHGTYQMGEQGLRITGLVLEVESGKLVGGLKATGTTRDLFALEDTIAEQAKQILARHVSPATQPLASAEPAAPVQLSPPPQPEQPSDAYTEPIYQPRRPSWYYDDDYYSRRWPYNYSLYPTWTYGSWYYPGVIYGRYYRHYPRHQWGGAYYFPGGIIRFGTGQPISPPYR